MYRAALLMNDFSAPGVRPDRCRPGKGQCQKAPGRTGQTVDGLSHGSAATDQGSKE
jgi:hypothetical protein